VKICPGNIERLDRSAAIERLERFERLRPICLTIA
jgi:hypothetical protein